MKHRSALLAGAACLAALAIPACASDGYGPGYGAPQPEGVILFEGENYTGTSLPVTGPIPRLDGSYRFNDAASSVEVLSGTWEICADANFAGRCERLTTSTPSLRGLRFDNAMSSLRPVDGYGTYPGQGSGGYASITFYADTDMRGAAVSLDRDEPDFGRAGFNDRARSLDVRGGVWEVCTDGRFGGRCEIIDRPVRDLRDLRMSGSISSARLVPDDPYRRYGSDR